MQTATTRPAGAFAFRGPDPTEQSANGARSGPYQTRSYMDGFAPGTFTAAMIWYPASPDAEPPFACITMVPGMSATLSSLEKWGPFLASHGFVLFLISTPGGDQPAMRADALMSALDSCVAENVRADSPLKGKLSPEHLAVSGWSMGGGGALLAAAQNPSLKAAVSFAAWNPTGGETNRVPALMFEGTADALAAGMSDAFYSAIPAATPKMLFEVDGANHMLANDPANEDGLIGLYALSWLKVFVEGDTRYRPLLTAPAPDRASKFLQNL
jgi:dienelactone hydrolase